MTIIPAVELKDYYTSCGVEDYYTSCGVKDYYTSCVVKDYRVHSTSIFYDISYKLSPQQGNFQQLKCLMTSFILMDCRPSLLLLVRRWLK